MRIEDNIVKFIKDRKVYPLSKGEEIISPLNDKLERINVTYILTQEVFTTSIWELLEIILDSLNRVIKVLNTHIKNGNNEHIDGLKDILRDIKNLYKINENIKRELNSLKDNYTPNLIKNMLVIFKTILSMREKLENIYSYPELNIFCKQEMDNLKDISEKLKGWESLVKNFYDKGFLIFPLGNFKHRDKDIQVTFCYEKEEGKRGDFFFVLNIPTENLGMVRILGKVLDKQLELEGEVQDTYSRSVLINSEKTLKDSLRKVNYELKRLFIDIFSSLKEEQKHRIELEI